VVEQRRLRVRGPSAGEDRVASRAAADKLAAENKISAEVARAIKGKTTLRYFTCFINKGVELLTLFAATGGLGPPGE